MLKDDICPLMAVMTQGERMEYITRQVINKTPLAERKQQYELFVAKMDEYGIIEIYKEYIQPYEAALNLQ